MPNIYVCQRQTKRSKRKAALNLAFGFPRATVACGGSANSPDKSGLRQCITFLRMQPLRSAALNGIKSNRVSPTRSEQCANVRTRIIVFLVTTKSTKDTKLEIS